MYAGHWVSVAFGAADGVVEKEDTLGTGDVFKKKGFHFGVVVLFDRGVICERLLG